MPQRTISKSVEMPHLVFAPSRPVTLLINGGSRRGRASFPAAVKACRNAGISLAESVMVTSPEETARLLQREIEAQAPLVIVGGGDGTLSFCAGQLAGTTVSMGVLPLGTGNTFARTLCLPFDLNRAAQVMAEGHVSDIDVGLVNGRVFLNSVTMGLSAEIAHALDALIKRRLGLLAYPVVGGRVFLRHRALRLRINIDGRSFPLRTHQLVIANGRYIAGPVAATPDASIDDKRLKVFVLGGARRDDLLRAGWEWLRGRQLHFAAQALSVEIPRGAIASVDGELVPQTHIDLNIWPDALRVVVPHDFDSHVTSSDAPLKNASASDFFDRLR